MKEIAFTKVRLPYGWLGNMSPHPVRLDEHGLVYSTAEHLFQSLRFSPEDPVRDAIRAERSPMAAKMLARKNDRKMVITRCGHADLRNMASVLRLKVEQHPDLRDALLDTGDAHIVEDVTNRQRGSALFWGAARDGNLWRGENRLGLLWMDLRDRLRRIQT